jgi:hypothetical protein
VGTVDENALEGFVNDLAGSDDGGSEPEETPEDLEAGSETASETGEEVAPPADGDVVPDPEDPAEQTPKQQTGLRKALEAQRKQRQDAERRANEAERAAAQLQGQVSVYQQGGGPERQTAEEADPEDAFYGDPVGFVRSQVDAVRAESRGDSFVARRDIGEEFMRAQHDDYDDVIASFVDAARTNPRMIDEYERQPNPAKYAYEYGKVLRGVGDVGSLDQLREKIRAEEREKLVAEGRKKSANDAAAGATTSSAGARGAGAVSPADAGSVDDMDFDEILKDVHMGTRI